MTVKKAKAIFESYGWKILEVDREVVDTPAVSKPKPKKPRKPLSDSQRLAKEFDKLLRKNQNLRAHPSRQKIAQNGLTCRPVFIIFRR